MTTQYQQTDAVRSLVIHEINQRLRADWAIKRAYGITSMPDLRSPATALYWKQVMEPRLARAKEWLREPRGLTAAGFRQWCEVTREQRHLERNNLLARQQPVLIRKAQAFWRECAANRAANKRLIEVNNVLRFPRGASNQARSPR